MKKQLLLAATFVAVSINAEAQKPDTAQLIVHYKFTHVKDTTDREHPYTENMALFVGKSASAYKSYDGLLATQQFKKEYAAAVAASPDGNIRINRRGGGSSTQYYEFPNEQKLFTKENLLINDYLIEDAMPAIDWKISGDTASFGGLHCQQAKGHFKGRDYIVWFCPDLPIHTGPWKLNGLPGVIVDAHDATNTVVFKFDGVEKAIPTAKTQLAGGPDTKPADVPPILRGVDDDPNLITPPADAIKTTRPEFQKLKAAMAKDPNAFVNAQLAANQHGADGPKADHVLKMKVAPGGPRSSVTNNPIELPEK